MNDQAMSVTTILLPPDLRQAVEIEAEQKQVSMAAVIRWALIDRYAEKLAAQHDQVQQPQPQAA